MPFRPPPKFRGPYLVLCFVGGNPAIIYVDDLSRMSTCLNPSTSSFAPEKTTALLTFSVFFVKSSSLIYRESSLDFSTFLINSPLEFLSQLPSGDSPPISNYPLSILSLSSILTSSSLTVLPLKPFTIS